MKKKGTKQFNGNLAPMHTLGDANGAYVSVFPAVQTEEAIPAEKTEKKKPVAVGYRILSAVLLLFAVGGLFLGLLCNAVAALAPFSVYRAVLTEGAFGASAVGMFVEIFRNFAVYSQGVGNKIRLAVLFFFALCVLVSVVCSLVAFVSGKKAKLCAHVNATALLLGYGSLFVMNFAQLNATFSSPELGFAKQMFDLPTAIVAAASLIVLLALVFSDKRAGGKSVGGNFFRLLLLAGTLGVLLAFFYPGTATAGYMTLFQTGLFTAKGAACGAAVLILTVLFAFNFLAAVVRLNFKKGFAFDAVRYGLQLCALVFFFVMARDRAVFGQKTAVVVCLTVAAFLLFALPLLAALLSELHKREVKDAKFAEEAETLQAEEPTVEEPAYAEPAPLLYAEENVYTEEPPLPEPDGVAAVLDETNAEPAPKEQYIDEFAAEMIQSEKEETTMIEPTDETFNDRLNDDLQDDALDESYESAPAPQQPVYAAPAPRHEEDREEIIVFTADNFDPNNPMLLPTAGEPSEAIGSGASLWAGMPPVRERIVEKIVEVEKKKPKVELTEFEKLMAEQAKEPVAPVNEAAFDPLPFTDGARQNQPIIQQTFITNPAAQAPAAAPVPAAIPAPTVPATPAPAVPAPAPAVPVPDFTDRIERDRRDRYDPQYTYDPFINTLTPEERSEFGDVFISHRHGIQNYLPAYVIGGDNRKFFRLLFVHLGRYREFITQNLMDKMYAFVSSKK